MFITVVFFPSTKICTSTILTHRSQMIKQNKSKEKKSGISKPSSPPHHSLTKMQFVIPTNTIIASYLSRHHKEINSLLAKEGHRREPTCQQSFLNIYMQILFSVSPTQKVVPFLDNVHTEQKISYIILVSDISQP